MKHWWLALFLSLCAGTVYAQSVDSIQVQRKESAWNGHYYNEKYRINLRLDLDSASLIAPGFEAFGTVNGYLTGGVYGTWFLVRHEKTEQGLRLRFTNDLGSFIQVFDFQLQPDSTYTYDAVGTNEMRRSEGRKLIKIEPHLVFVKK